MIKSTDLLEDLISYNVIVESDKDLEMLAELLDMKGCQDIEQIAQKFSVLSGHEVYDYRENSEYTGVNAQSDIDFFQEEPLTENNSKMWR